MGVLWSISQTFGMQKDAKLVFPAWMHYFGVSKLRKWFRNEYTHFTPLHPKWCLGVLRSISQNLRHVKWCKTCVSALNTLFQGIEVAKMISQRIHSFFSIRPKMMFGSAPEHFANLRHVKRCKTCVSGLNTLFQGTEVTKMVSQQIHPFYSIRPKMMFGSAPEHFANLRHVKRCKTCVSGLNTLF